MYVAIYMTHTDKGSTFGSSLNQTDGKKNTGLAIKAANRLLQMCSCKF